MEDTHRKLKILEGEGRHRCHHLNREAKQRMPLDVNEPLRAPCRAGALTLEGMTLTKSPGTAGQEAHLGLMVGQAWWRFGNTPGFQSLDLIKCQGWDRKLNWAPVLAVSKL